MDHETFWTLVADIGWGTKTTDVSAIKSRLVREWSREQADAFNSVLYNLEGELYQKLDASDLEFGLGDDGFGDLISHILGLGKEDFWAVMSDPRLALKRANAPYGSPEGHAEKFAYCIPDDSDYDKLDGKPYVKWAKENVQSLTTALDQPIIKGTLFKVLQDIRAWNQLVADGNYTEALAGGEALVANLDMVEPLKAKVVGTMAQHHEVNEALAHFYWGNKNLLTDLQEIPPVKSAA